MRVMYASFVLVRVRKAAQAMVEVAEALFCTAGMRRPPMARRPTRRSAVTAYRRRLRFFRWLVTVREFGPKSRAARSPILVRGAKLVAVSTCHGRLVRHLDNRRVRLPLRGFHS